MIRYYPDISPHHYPVLGHGRRAFVKSLPKNLDCCKCIGGPQGYKLLHEEGCVPLDTGKCSKDCWKWVHYICGKQSFGFARECQVCQELYMPKMWPDYDWVCSDCYP